MTQCVFNWKGGRSVFCRKAENARFHQPAVKKTRPAVNSVAQDVYASEPIVEKRNLRVRKILSSSSWSHLLDDQQKLLPASASEILTALAESVPNIKGQGPHYRMVDAMVEDLVKEGHFDFAVELLERCIGVEIVKDASIGIFFKACYNSKRFDIALRSARHWIRTAQKEFRGHAANYLMYYGFLSGDVDGSLEILRSMHRNKIPFTSEYPYSIMLHTCNAQERWEDALEVYYLFKETRFKHKPIFIRNLLYAVRGGNYRVFFGSLVDELLENRFRISYDLYKAMMETCKHFTDLPRAKNVFKTVYQHHIKFDARCINTLLSIYKDSVEFPPLEDCFHLFERLGVRPDAFTFGLLMGSAYLTDQPVEIIDRILQEAKAWDVELNPVIVSSACVAYSRAKKDPIEERLSKAIALLLTSPETDQDCYHVVMSICVEFGHLEKALEVQEKMETAGFSSCRETYRLLTEKCFGIGLVDHALSFQDKMEEFTQPTESTSV